MTLQESGIIQSSLLLEAGIIHGISTKKQGNMSFDRDERHAPQNLQNFFNQLNLNLKQLSLIILPVQNSTNVALLNQPKKTGRLIIDEKSTLLKKYHKFDAKSGFDACISKAQNTFLAILPADCAAVMMYDLKSKYYALIHAGRASIEAGIILKTIFCLKLWLNIEPKNLLCYIGPNICARCYQINGKNFNISKEIIFRLKHSGVREENIETSKSCTAENKDLFFSNYRAKASKTEGRQIAIIGKK